MINAAATPASISQCLGGRQGASKEAPDFPKVQRAVLSALMNIAAILNHLEYVLLALFIGGIRFPSNDT